MITKEELTRDSLLEYALVLEEDYANSQGKIDDLGSLIMH